MAKGQKRSNREIKKPKKSAAEKAKTGVAASFIQAPGAARKPSAKTR